MTQKRIPTESVSALARSTPRFAVVIFNDDVTTQETATLILASVFHLPMAVADRVMLEIHEQGYAVAAVASEDEARALIRSANSLAFTQSAPLRIAMRRANADDEARMLQLRPPR